VLAKDAKFIGTGMGGVRVTITDAVSGELLAQGITEGGVGDTERIIEQPRKRGVPLATEDAAAFHATIDIDRPRRVEVLPPLARRHLVRPHVALEVRLCRARARAEPALTSLTAHDSLAPA